MPALVFSKTTQGRNEIDNRAAGLSAKARRLLILVDGQRNLAELGIASGLGDELGGLLEQLLAADMIAAPLSTPPANMAGTLPVPEIPAAEVVAPQPPLASSAEAISIDPARLLEAKQLMLDTAQRYLGLMGRDITARISAAQDIGALRGCIARWTTAMRETREGGAVVARYLEEINACLC
ncbi:MAG: hypothetical protein JO142_11730 [Burkholderiales bacterium]|nr:hypothetical protein [Burkholderiales bacterium]